VIRTLAGAATGIAIAIVVMMIVEATGNALAPPPSLDLTNPNAPSALPPINQLIPVLGWFVASLAGGWLAIQISTRAWASWIVAASVLVGELIDYLLGRHPLWVMAVGVIAPVAAAWIAQKLPGRSRRTNAN
jgi:hypothetical protein